MQAVLERDSKGDPIRKAGVMAVVRRNGGVCRGDEIQVLFTPDEAEPLEPV